MTDFRDSLYSITPRGDRNWVYADIVSGAWRKHRQIVVLFLLFIYLVVPWINLDRHPLLQFDIPNGRIYILGQGLWPHEISIFVPIILSFAFFIWAITAWLGRVWCGWACPHTVFLEFFFRPVEQWIEGRASERRRNDQIKKFTLRKLLKWIIFAVIAFILANNFLAFFVGARNLINMMSSSPSENPKLFATMMAMFSAVLFNFGWFREQMCTITCPYGRLQSVLLDPNSKIVGYDSARGEPRGKLGSTKGDCVDCNRCVVVCPTGIDIRNGVQMECVGCLACIDACNDVMTKIKKPQNLIKLTSENELKNNTAAKPSLRPFVYLFISLSLGFFGLTRLFNRIPLELKIMRTGSVNFSVEGNFVYNHLSLILINKSDRAYKLEINPNDAKSQFKASRALVVAPANEISVDIEATTPVQEFTGSGKVKAVIEMYNTEDSIKVSKELTLFGPQK